MQPVHQIWDDQLLLVRSALKFFIVELNLTSFEDQIDIELYTPKKIQTSYGYALPVYKKNKLQKLVVRIRNQPSVWGMIECLAHEMVHVQQYFHGKLAFKTEEVKFWGIFSDIKMIQIYEGSPVDLPYEKRPWEIEAFNRQAPLTKRFFEVFYGLEVKNEQVPQ